MKQDVVVPVPLPDRASEVRVGSFGPGDAAAVLAAALGKPTGVAILTDGRVAAASPRVPALVAALAERLPRVRRLDLSPGESCKTLSAVERTCQWLAGDGYDPGAPVIGIAAAART